MYVGGTEIPQVLKPKVHSAAYPIITLSGLHLLSSNYRGILIACVLVSGLLCILMLAFDRTYSLQIPSAFFLCQPGRHLKHELSAWVCQLQVGREHDKNREPLCVSPLCVCEHRAMSKTDIPVQCVRIPHANPISGITYKACMFSKKQQKCADHMPAFLPGRWQMLSIFGTCKYLRVCVFMR